jgi:DNA polymerase elongation subunit (family B)
MQTKRKRLYFDIETSPNIGLFWQAGYKQKIDYSNIIKERGIICICYKWEDEKEVHSLHWDKKQCDKKLLQEFIKVANQADELVGHNGDKFDLPWIRTRCLYHRVDLFPKYVTIDTLKLSRRQFRFNSNRLDYIASYLGIGKKIKTDFNLWKDIVLNKCDKSMKKMIDYCKQDVKLLGERVLNVAQTI